jgi:hypothetical protein
MRSAATFNGTTRARQPHAPSARRAVVQATSMAMET